MKVNRAVRSNNNMFRAVYIRNFRNIGLYEETKVILNRSISKEELGNIVLLIGQNNSGKSNVLDAIEVANTGRFNDADYPDVSLSHAKLIPSVRFEISDGETHYSDCKRTFLAERTNYPTIIEKNNNSYDIKAIENDERFSSIVKKAASELIKNDNDMGAESVITYGIISSEIIDYVFYNTDKTTLSDIVGTTDMTYFYDVLFKISNNVCPIRPKVKTLANIKTADTNPFEEKFNETYGYPLIPRVIRYEDKPLNNNDLRCGYRPLGRFMRTILILIDGIKILVEGHQSFEKTGDIEILKETEDELNTLLKEITYDFNKMYADDNFEYKFYFVLTPNDIELKIGLSELELSLEKQSTGFRWYFDLYFNFLGERKIKAGDVVIMDEPATNIHVSGQIELKRFLRRLAREIKATFIISTHSPFLIEPDYLDEVQIVKRIENGSSVVIDKFSKASFDYHDQMEPILKCLTIGRGILLRRGEKEIFVEGVTDYNYMTAFKHILNMKEFAFTPINGAGDSDKAREQIIENLKTIYKSPILLADGDITGMELKKKAEGTGIKVIMLNEANADFTDIESLFSNEDLSNFGLRRKSWNNSSIFKQHYKMNIDMISDKTKNNFAKLFDFLKKVCLD